MSAQLVRFHELLARFGALFPQSSTATSCRRLLPAYPSSFHCFHDSLDDMLKNGVPPERLFVYVRTREDISRIPALVKNVVLEVPSGELSSRRFFNMGFPECRQRMAGAIECAHASGKGVHVLMCGALSCSMEGRYVPPYRIADETAAYLSLGCAEVIWEDGIGACRPRNLENFCKTTVASGCSLDSVTVMLRNTENNAFANVAKALEMGITSFCTLLSTPDKQSSHRADSADHLLKTEDFFAWLANIEEEQGGAPSLKRFDCVKCAHEEWLRQHLGKG